MKRLKVVTIVGTRPEIIRLSRLVPKLDEFTDHILVHTGQNYDPHLSEVFFEELEIRTPDHFLKVDTSSFATAMADTLKKSEELLQKEKPDAVMILGDTNSAIAAIVAERMHIPVYHMEAGNRSFDLNVPEELNRRIIDHVATFNLPYTEHARRNLLAEGVHPGFIHKTGSPLPEVIEHYSSQIMQSDVLSRLGLAEQGYILASMHRQENLTDSGIFQSFLVELNDFAEQFQLAVLFSTHPRTMSGLLKLKTATFSRIRFEKPFGFFDYLSLQRSAYCVISDSGSIAEEAYILGIPAVTIRQRVERPEAVESGALVVQPLDGNQLRSAIPFSKAGNGTEVQISDYEIKDFSQRVLHILFSTAHDVQKRRS